MATIAPPPVERIIGRRQHAPALDEPLGRLMDKTVLITGAAGSIGTAVCSILAEFDPGIATFATDIDECDVRDFDQVSAWVDRVRPDVVIHMAGAKHAPQGEQEPEQVALTNIAGTANVVRAAARHDARVVTASTCKAADPETAYGASKLIAERITLNAGGSVARFYNVVESSGNVFEIWDALPEDEPLPVSPCGRYFISLAEAVSLVLWTAAVLPPGRYTPAPGKPRQVSEIAADLYPGRPVSEIAPRRGDRLVEPEKAACELLAPTAVPSIFRIVSPHEAHA